MASDAEVARAGAKAHIEVFTDEHEGFRDYERISSNNPDAHAASVDRIAFYDERKRRCEAFIVAADALIAHGYPEIPVFEVSPEALANFQTNASTIQAALRKIASNVATSLTVTGGTSEPKEPPAASRDFTR